MKIYSLIIVIPMMMHSLIMASSQPGVQSYNGFNFWNVGPYTSVFSDEIVGERYDCVSINFQYGVNTSDVSITTSASGTTSSSNSMAIVSTGTTANSSSLLQSNQDIIYNAGHEAHALFSCIFFNGGSTGTSQWIGAFNTTDGFAVGFNGTQFSIMYNNNTVNTIIPNSSFNGDPLDGTGQSRFTYDPTKVNVFRIAYGWLSSSPVLFQVLGPNGYFITFHTLNLMNISTTPSLSNPSLPISMQVTNTTTSNVSMGSAAWNGATVQRKTVANVINRRFYIYNSAFSTSASGETMLFAIRNSLTFNNVVNGVMDYFQTFRIMPFATTPSVILLFIRKNPTLNNTSYTTNFSESPNQLTTSGTISSGGTLLSVLPFSYNSATNTIMPITSGDKGAPVIINPGDVISFSIQNFSGATSIGLIIEVSFQEVR